MQSSISTRDYAEKEILHKIKLDASMRHLYGTNKDFIAERTKEFAKTQSCLLPEDVNQFTHSLRQDIHRRNASTEEKQKIPKRYIFRTFPGEVPENKPPVIQREPKVHSQETIDFMYRSQMKNSETYKREREEVVTKATQQKLKEYIPPDTGYKPPIQFYDKNRPYFQEYIRYKNELRPVVMPVFSEVKGSFRDKAKSQYMVREDPNRVSKRDQYFIDRKDKAQEEMRAAEDIKMLLKSKKLEETKRLRQEAERQQQHQQRNQLTSSSNSQAFILPRSAQSSRRSFPLSGRSNSNPYSRPKTANDRPNYPTAGTFWLTHV